jgi:hypothetical protein
MIDIKKTLEELKNVGNLTQLDDFFQKYLGKK